jgi:hypothetical protein
MGRSHRPCGSERRRRNAAQRHELEICDEKTKTPIVETKTSPSTLNSETAGIALLSPSPEPLAALDDSDLPPAIHPIWISPCNLDMVNDDSDVSPAIHPSCFWSSSPATTVEFDTDEEPEGEAADKPTKEEEFKTAIIQELQGRKAFSSCKEVGIEHDSQKEEKKEEEEGGKEHILSKHHAPSAHVAMDGNFSEHGGGGFSSSTHDPNMMQQWRQQQEQRLHQQQGHMPEQPPLVYAFPIHPYQFGFGMLLQTVLPQYRHHQFLPPYVPPINPRGRHHNRHLYYLPSMPPPPPPSPLLMGKNSNEAHTHTYQQGPAAAAAAAAAVSVSTTLSWSSWSSSSSSSSPSLNAAAPAFSPQKKR